jgi:hypothetical protein
LNEWLPAEVRQFYETQMDTTEKRLAILDDPARRTEWERVNDLVPLGHPVD